jgi:internalin A
VSKLRAWKSFSVMMALVLTLGLGVQVMLPVPAVLADTVVTFPDANLEAVIRQALSKPTGDIYASELATLTSLIAVSKGIVNLTGLEYCTNLRLLLPSYNQISNLMPLAGLTSLTELNLTGNQISDLTGLQGLTNLGVLSLGSNQISNLTPLAGLTNLRWLNLDYNQISNLTPLAGLTNLRILYILNNQISNLTPLAGLTSLTDLMLQDNRISDLTGLAGLTNLNQLNLSNNQISDLTGLHDLPNLRYLNLSDNQIGNLTGLDALPSLQILELHRNQISNLTGLEGLTSLQSLWLSNNRISDLTRLSGLTSLTCLDLCFNQISNLTGLGGLTNLQSLLLGGNQISNLAGLVGLNNLTQLDLHNNQISNLTGLGGLTNLRSINLEDNQISDLIPLVDNAGLAEGDWVHLEDNPLSQISIHVHIPTLRARGVTIYWGYPLAVATNPATNITTTSAMLNGNLTSLGTSDNVTVSFQWRATSDNYTDETPIEVKSSLVTFGFNLTGLNTSTTYHFRAKAVSDNTSSDNTSYGSDEAFTTSGALIPINTTTGTGTAIFTSNLGNIVNLTAVAEGTLPTSGKPLGVTFPNGLFSFNITNIPPGSNVIITITYPAPIPQGVQYWKCQNGTWINCTSLIGDDDGDEVLTLTITDGGLGDSDGQVNGQITDPGGPVISVPAPASAPHVSPALPRDLNQTQISLQYLSVNPQQAQVNQPLTILGIVVNTGNQAGNYNLILKINGRVEQTRMVSVGPQGTQPVKFTITKAQPGTYAVDLGGQTGSFTVVGQRGHTANTSSSGGLIVFLILSVLILATVVLVIRRLA